MIRTASLLWSEPTMIPTTSSPRFKDHHPTLQAAVAAAMTATPTGGLVPYILVHSGTHGTTVLDPAAIVVLDREFCGGIANRVPSW
jgi:glyoxylate utilization-related uncharacterized protein